MLDGTHLHLALNHFPVIGFSLVLILAIVAWVLKNSTLKLASCFGAVLIGLLIYPVYETGEIADEKIERLRPTSEAFIEEHEEAAEKVVWLAGLSGLLGLVGVLHYARKKVISVYIYTAMVISLFFSSVGLAWVANLGGQISHPEIRKNTGPDHLIPPKKFEKQYEGDESKF